MKETNDMGDDLSHLRDVIAEILSEELEKAPQRMELVLPTGELLSEDAMNLARLYDRSNNGQRAALDAVADIIRDATESGKAG